MAAGIAQSHPSERPVRPGLCHPLVAACYRRVNTTSRDLRFEVGRRGGDGQASHGAFLSGKQTLSQKPWIDFSLCLIGLDGVM